MNEKKQDKFYITTPIYYVNSAPHLGHAYTSILCDTANRYHTMTGAKTFFLTGTDEHGDKIQKSAAKNNIAPQKYVDGIASKFKDLLPIIDAKNSAFIRTTDQRHKETVQMLLQKVYDNGDIYFKEYTGRYCFGCERFLGDDELVEGKCPDHGTEPELISEQNYFFKMSKYWEELKSHIDRNPEFIVPENFRKETIGLLKQEPQDLCISRPKSRLTWGIELPFDSNFVTYVWFDALINYLSGVGHPSDDLFKDYWPVSHHVIAKDILKPHCIYWPTMLLSMGIALPHQVAIHGYWLIDESKMSKSQGRTIDPIEYCEKFGSDIFRYFLIRNMKFGRDASFTDKVFYNSINADLANNIGNLYSRIAGMCKKNCQQKIPEAKNIGDMETGLIEAAAQLPQKLDLAMKQWHTDEYLKQIIEFANMTNKYLDEKKPWSLAKDEKNREELETILRTSLEAVRICLSWLWPITPQTSEKALTEMGIENSPEAIFNSACNWNILNTGHELPKKVTGFPRLESEPS